MTKLEMILGCEFTLVRDGAFDVITIRTPTKGNDPVALRGNAARMRFSDYILACADGMLTGKVPRNLLWEQAQELAEKCKDEYRRLRSQS